MKLCAEPSGITGEPHTKYDKGGYPPNWIELHLLIFLLMTGTRTHKEPS